MSAVHSFDDPKHPAFPIWDRVTRRTTAKTVEEIFDLERRVGYLEKLEQLLRKRIKLYRDSPPGGSRNWRANEDTYELLAGLLKEAGLE